MASFAHPQPVTLDFDRPMLLVVVDTEEEFDWSKPFDRAATATAAIPAQDHAHAVYDRYGIAPTYVIDYPVATNTAAVAYLRNLVESGRAQIGTHCHPWVNPPYDEPLTAANSYHGNLPPELEAAKIAVLTDAIAQGFGFAPWIFKAGRYGIGPATLDIIASLGYRLDCSLVPHSGFTGDGGPDFHGLSDKPFYVDSERKLLEVPLTMGFSGAAARLGPSLSRLFDSRLAMRARLPGILSRLGLVERARLSPEGFSAAEQMRLLRAMIGQGRRLFSLTYHSPSLAPGHTPYVRSEAERDQFVATIEAVLRAFRDELGGGFTTLAAVDAAARSAA